jgi:uncharacterized damage-inducible protein DinB
MNLQDLQTLVDYHYWARDRVLAAIEPLTAEQFDRNLGSSFPSIRATIAHTYSAEWAWYERWQGRSPTQHLSIDQFPTAAAVRRSWADLEPKVRAFVNGLDDAAVNRVIEYRLLSGAPGAAPIWQMVQHVVNHASYHRGQITTMLRQIGAAPGQSMDLIAYYRLVVSR